jgi:hypothetical protein
VADTLPMPLASVQQLELAQAHHANPATLRFIASAYMRLDIEALGFQHQLNGLSGSAVILNQQNAHANRFLVI